MENNFVGWAKITFGPFYFTSCKQQVCTSAKTCLYSKLSSILYMTNQILQASHWYFSGYEYQMELLASMFVTIHFLDINIVIPYNWVSLSGP